MPPNLTLRVCAGAKRLRAPLELAASQSFLLLLLASATCRCAIASENTARNSVRFRPSATVGIYHWGGRHANGVASGIRDLLDLNAGIVRISLSARMDIDYNRGTSCIAGFTLASALDDPDLRNALADHRLKVAMITAYDGASFADCVTPSYLSLGFYSPANTASVVNEYADFVHRLYVLFENTGKKFILSNWEGDNALYCGQAASYARSEEFRAACLSNYSLAYDGNRSPHDSVEGMVLWFQARHRGVTLGKERARIEGRTGIEVLVAPEFSAVHMLRDQGFASVLSDVIPRVPFDCISYSCYESLAHSEPDSALTADLDWIRRITGSDRIILGELGFSRSALGHRLIPTTRAATQAAIRWGVAYVIQWNLYDQDRAVDFGLFDLDGNLTELGAHYRQVFSLQDRVPPSRLASRE